MKLYQASVLNLRYIGLIGFLLFLFNQSQGQVVKELQNTSQGWAGGPCCVSGVNYNFNILFSAFKNEPVPDTIWVGGQDIPLSLTDGELDGYTANTQVKRAGKTLTFHIAVGTSHDEKADQYPGIVVKKPKPAPIPQTGVAILSYHEKGSGKRHFFTIKKVKELEFQSYP